MIDVVAVPLRNSLCPSMRTRAGRSKTTRNPARYTVAGNERSRAFAIGRFVATLVALASSLPVRVVAQATPRTVFQVDFGSGAIVGSLPFDEPFVLSAPAPSTFREVRLWVGSRLQREECHLLAPPPHASSGGTHSTNVDASARTDFARASARADSELAHALKARDSLIEALAAEQQQHMHDSTVPASVKQAEEAATRALVQVEDARRAKDALRMTADPTAWWSRANLDSANVLLLDVGPIEPNRDYTFCFEVVRRLAPAQADTFAMRAASNVGDALRRIGRSQIETLQALDTMQLALIAALPASDSLEVTDLKSIFLRPASQDETADERKSRLARLIRLYTHARTLLGNADNATRAFNDATVAAIVPRATRALERIHDSSSETLLKLGSIDDSVTDRVGPRYTASASLARQLAFFSKSALPYVARGLQSLDDASSPLSVPPITQRTNTAAIQLREQALQRTALQLDSLARLAAFAASRRPVLERLHITTAALTRLAVQLDSVQDALHAVRNALEQIRIQNQGVDASVKELVAGIRSLDFAYVALRGTTAVSYEARARTYISLDAGFLGGRGVREVVPYLGINVYGRPVNKNMPLSGCRCLSRRIALTVGVTASSIKQDKRLEDLFNSHAVLLGFGLRLTDYWRATGGALFAKSYPDGVDRPAKITGLPALATSIDLDVLGLLGKAGTFLIPNFK